MIDGSGSSGTLAIGMMPPGPGQDELQFHGKGEDGYLSRLGSHPRGVARPGEDPVRNSENSHAIVRAEQEVVQPSIHSTTSMTERYARNPAWRTLCLPRPGG